MPPVRHAILLTSLFAVTAWAQPPDRTAALVDAVRPALPYPDADASGELPATGAATARWFVIWPSPPDEPRITVKANPLHAETQAATAAAMAAIQAAVVAAERKAQAAYDEALAELKRTGKGSDLAGVTLEDEGVAGERIDAELALTIEHTGAASFEVRSSSPPVAAAGTNGPSWVITTPPNTYRDAGDGGREHFAAAEARLFFGVATAPAVTRSGADRFQVAVSGGETAFAVVLRGNAALLGDVLAAAQWSRLGRRAP